MTRTVRIELADVAAWPNLEAALWSAAQGKRQRRDVAAFLDAAPQRLEAVRLPCSTRACPMVACAHSPSATPSRASSTPPPSPTAWRTTR